MSLEELYLKVTNEHLPEKVRQLLPDPISGYSNPEFTTDWRQFEKVGEDELETVKVRFDRNIGIHQICKKFFSSGFYPSGLGKLLSRLSGMWGAC